MASTSSNNELKLSSLVRGPAVAAALVSSTFWREASTTYEGLFGDSKDQGRPTGSTISIYKPPIFTVDENITDLNVQDVKETAVSVTTVGRKVEIGADRYQGTFEFPGTSQGIISEMGIDIGGAIGANLEQYAINQLAANSVVVADASNAVDGVYGASEALNLNLSRGDAIFCAGPRLARLLKNERQLVEVVNQGGSELNVRGLFGEIDMHRCFESPLLNNIVATVPGTAPTWTFTEGSQTATVSAETSLYVGMPISLGVNLVNAQTKGDTGVVATRTIVAISGKTVTLSEPVYTATSGNLQNVAAAAVSGLTVSYPLAAGTYAQGVLWSKKAFEVGSILPVKGESVKNFSIEAEDDFRGKINIRCIYSYSHTQNKNILSAATTAFAKTVRPEWIAKVLYKIA